MESKTGLCCGDDDDDCELCQRCQLVIECYVISIIDTFTRKECAFIAIINFTSNLL